MAVNTVARSVDQAINETVQKRNFIGEDDILLNPSLTPILTLTTKAGNRKKPTKSVRIEWPEDDYVGHWGQANNGGDISTATTTFTVLDGTLFNVGDLVLVPRIASSASAEEIIRVTGVAGNVLTVTRGIGGAGGDTIGTTSDLRILSSAYAEGGAFGKMRSTTKAVKISYTQIFRRPVQITKSMVSQEQFGPSNERLFQRKKALQEHLQEIESAGLWSRPSESLATPGSIRTTMGFKSRIVTNVYNANQTLTEGGMLAFAELSFGKYFQGTEKLLVASLKVISAFNYFALGHQRTQPSDDIYGVKVKRFNTGHGDFLITRDLLLENGPVNGFGFGSEAYALDMDSVSFVPLAGNGISRDTTLLTDVVKDGSDNFQDEYLTEAGWAIRDEARHARMYNVLGYA